MVSVKSKRALLLKVKKLPSPIIGNKSGTVNRYGVFKGKKKTPDLVAETKASAKNAIKAFAKESVKNPKSRKVKRK